MNHPMPLPVRIGKPVKFKPPKGAINTKEKSGRVIDSIASGPHLDADWGYYYYVSDLIEWPGESQSNRSIRLGYYYAPIGSDKWRWGGQYSIEDSPKIIHAILQQTLGQATWFTGTREDDCEPK